MTEYGIGYTIFKFEDGIKTPVQICKAKPGNVKQGMEFLKKRLDKIGNNRVFVNVAMWTMVYGFTTRLLIAI